MLPCVVFRCPGFIVLLSQSYKLIIGWFLLRLGTNLPCYYFKVSVKKGAELY